MRYDCACFLGIRFYKEEIFCKNVNGGKELHTVICIFIVIIFDSPIHLSVSLKGELEMGAKGPHIVGSAQTLGLLKVIVFSIDLELADTFYKIEHVTVYTI